MRRYRKCMKRTASASVSNRMFLKYKRRWIEKRNESMKLDQEKTWAVHEAEDN